MHSYQGLIKNRLYQVNEELISYGPYQIGMDGTEHCQELKW